MKNLTPTANDLERQMRVGVLAMVPAARAFAQGMRDFDAVVEREYKAAGETYGPTIEGRYRWLMEVNAIVKARQERREALADARLMLALQRVRFGQFPQPPLLAKIEKALAK